jgi:hypothetical protein
MIAARGLFGTLNGFAVDSHSASNTEGMKSKAVLGDGRISVNPPPPQVVAPNGNTYLPHAQDERWPDRRRVNAPVRTANECLTHRGSQTEEG